MKRKQATLFECFRKVAPEAISLSEDTTPAADYINGAVGATEKELAKEAVMFQRTSPTLL